MPILFLLSTAYAVTLFTFGAEHTKINISFMVAMILLYLAAMIHERLIGVLANVSQLIASIILGFALAWTQFDNRWSAYDYMNDASNNTAHYDITGSILLNVVFVFVSIWLIFATLSKKPQKPVSTEVFGYRAMAGFIIGALASVGYIAGLELTVNTMVVINAIMFTVSMVGHSLSVADDSPAWQRVAVHATWGALSVLSLLFFVFVAKDPQFLGLLYLPLAVSAVVKIAGALKSAKPDVGERERYDENNNALNAEERKQYQQIVTK